MAATNFKTGNETYRKLMGNGLIYSVPRFQRDYSWGEEEWDDLWQDILGTVQENGEPSHYMGYLVLQTSDEKQFDVIDGQQRLTTLAVIVLASLMQLKRLIDQGQDVEKTQKRLDGLRQTYIGYLDPVTLVPKSKLTLNRNNDTYYQTYLVPLAGHLPQRGFKVSEHNLRKAFEWFERKIRDHVKSADDPSLAVAQLIDTMSDRLFFTVITVTDELNAYKVFETLNARGVKLSATDLLKNYLFSVLHRDGQHEHELKALDDRWEQIVGRLGSESFPDFLRVHWISRQNFVRQSDLFKVIRAKISDRAQVFELLSNMEQDMDAYLALTSPDSSGWSANAKGQIRILRMYGVRQPFPLLVAGKRVLGDADYETLLRAIAVISFRYNVIGNLQSNDQERAYFQEAEKVFKGEHRGVSQIIEGLRSIYPNDDSFRAAFAEKTLNISTSRNRRIAKHVLCELERQSSGDEIDFESDAISIEHVCPLNPGQGWEQFTDEEIEVLATRIGNLTLLETSQNKELGNASFEVKRAVYENSRFAITKTLADKNIEWTAQKIATRQLALAKIATGIWRIGQLRG